MMVDAFTNNGISIPRVGFGTYQVTGSEGTRSIEDALYAGYRHIDTAQAYHNEEEVGKAIRNTGLTRDKLYITTKVWPTDFRRLLPAVEESLNKLKLDFVDLLLLHWPSDEATTKKGIVLLNEALQKGYARSIGVSNFNLEQLARGLREAPLVCNQVEYHPFLSQEKMLDFLQQNKMFLTAYSPLALGKVMKDETLKALAIKYGKTVSQVALRWLIQQGDVAVIPKASSPERRRENLALFDFDLSPDDMDAIFGLNNGERLGNPVWAPRWD